MQLIEQPEPALSEGDRDPVILKMTHPGSQGHTLVKAQRIDFLRQVARGRFGK